MAVAAPTPSGRIVADGGGYASRCGALAAVDRATERADGESVTAV